MHKKIHLTFSLLPETGDMSVVEIEEKIRNEAKIPWCNEIEQVSVEDSDESYTELKKQGVSSSVARNIVDLYTE